MALSERKFIEMLIFINDYYANFNFDIKNKEKVKVWYMVFCNMEDDYFDQAVKSYCVNNTYPPQSPTSITKHIEQMKLQIHMTSDEAWDLGYGTIKELGFDFDRVYRRLHKHVYIVGTIKLMRSSFDNLKSDDVPFRKREFSTIYNEVIKASVRVEMRKLISHDQFLLDVS